MKPSNIYIILMGALFASGALAAESENLLPENTTHSLLQRGKMLEKQIQVRQKNASQRNDPTSKQYNIGYEDGYNKAVLDLLKSQLLHGVNLPEVGNLANSASDAENQTPTSVKPPLIIAPAYQSPTAAPVTTSRPVDSGSPTAAGLSRAASIAIPAPTIPLPPSSVTAVPSASAAMTPPAAVINKDAEFKSLMQSSTKRLEARDWAQAASLASAAINIRDTVPEAYINRSWAYAEQGFMDKALSDANYAIQLNPNDGRAYNNRAYTYELRDDIGRARADYVTACQLKFGNACGVVKKIDEYLGGRGARQNNAISELMEKSAQLIQRRDWNGLVAVSSDILAVDDKQSVAYINRAWARAELGQLDLALTDSGRAIKLNPKDPLAYNNRAYTYELMDNLPLARKDYQSACQLKYQSACGVVQKIDEILAQKTTPVTTQTSTTPTNVGDRNARIAAMISQSFERYREGNWHAVEQLSNQILSLDPKNALAYVNRGGARTEMGLIYNALQDIDHAIDLDPKLGIAHNNKAYALERMGNLNKAASFYQKACQLGVKQSCNDYSRLSGAR